MSRTSKRFPSKRNKSEGLRQEKPVLFEEQNGALQCRWISSPGRGKNYMKGGWTSRQKSDYAGFCRSWQGTLIMFFEDGAFSSRNNMKYEPED